MPSVQDKEAFGQRVKYAVQCLLRGSSTPRFDICFQMGDGDAVVAEIVRRAGRNPELHAAVSRRFGGKFPKPWLETAEKYAGTDDFSALAAKMREGSNV